jgi:DNA polymerase III sliding clamp (beta) subunit (PCNA family)
MDVSINFNYYFYEDYIIFFNDRYLQEAINPVESENVIIRFSKIYNENFQAEFTDGFKYSALVAPTKGW